MKMEVHNENEKGIRYGDRIIGRIVKVDKDRGYGFITSLERKFVRFFFHWSSLVNLTKKFNELEKGMMVEFIECYSDRGARGIQIRVIEDSEEKKENAPKK